MKTMERKSLLYKTGVEYGDYTLNHVEGCSHGCMFPCYAFMLAKRFGRVKTYDEWLEPRIASNALEILNKELPKLKEKIKSVHLCFTTDPFMYECPTVSEMSLKIIQRINQEDLPCTVLTKGILPNELANLSRNNEYGITLVSLSESFREKYEPGSAPYTDRIESLKYLHDQGYQTWISMEPYPTPNIFEQDLLEILNSISFVDKIIFGRINYNKIASSYKNHKMYYNELSTTVIDFCTTHNINYHIKNGTATE